MARNDHGTKSGHGHAKGPGGSVKIDRLTKGDTYDKPGKGGKKC